MFRSGINRYCRSWFLTAIASSSWFWPTSPANAQTTVGAPPLPEMFITDKNGINLGLGQPFVNGPSLSIGSPQSGGMEFHTIWSGSTTAAVWLHNWYYYVGGNAAGQYVVVVGGQSKSFSLSGPPPYVMTEISGNGDTLVTTSGGYLYTARDGTTITFSTNINGVSSVQHSLPIVNTSIIAPATTIQKPNGEITNFYYKSALWASGSTTYQALRIQSITNNRGYQLKFGYPAALQCTSTCAGMLPNTVMAINNAVDYCDPTADTCTSLSQTWPTLTGSPDLLEATTVTDSLSRQTKYAYNGVFLVGITRPSSTTATTTFTRSLFAPSAFFISSVIKDGVTTTYTYPASFGGALGAGGIATAVSTDSLGYTQTVTFDDDYHRMPTSVTDENGHKTLFTYDLYEHLSTATLPEGNWVQYTYDSRGNVTQTTYTPKPGSPLATIVTSAEFDSTCANPAKCNEPNWTKDGRLNETDYQYNLTTGQTLSVTKPADANGNRPQDGYSYTSLQAYFKNSSGSIAASGQAISLLTTLSQCASSTTCPGTPNQTITVTNYGSQVVGVANNLLPISTSVGSGDGVLTATTTRAYNSVGDVISVDGPRTDVSDVTTYRYDAVRQRVGEISPDPDGAGPLLPPAIRTTYNLDGQIIQVDQGTVAGTSDANWSAFVTLQSVATQYDSNARKVLDTAIVGGSADAVTQYHYDSKGRLDCTAVRMNPATYSALPASACSLATQGSSGPDRIENKIYDPASQVIAIQRAVGTTLQQNHASYGYTANGHQASVTDANNNLTAYTYDGFDRLAQVSFPSPTLGAQTANPSDYEQYAYDANSNRTSVRKRSGDTIVVTYDALNRETLRHYPGTVTPDVYSAYDLLGRRLSARLTSASGPGIIYQFDALGRAVSETDTTSGLGLSYQYDLAGNRTRFTYPDSNYIGYTFDAMNRMSQVGENGATSGPGLLATYSYDALSRPTALTFGNGTSTSLAYSSNSLSWSFSQNLTGTAQDLTVNIARNPANQMASKSLSNSLYSYSASTSSQAYQADGLNRYTSVAGVSFGYDARQNLTSDGSRTFTYDLENRLLTVAGSASMTLSYDPLGRLQTTTTSGSTTTFLYAGDELVAEYNGTTLLRRYVFGAGVDRPLVWLEGAGLTNPQALHADERGSVIATSNSSGTGTIYTYGTYGEPGQSNWTGSRFRYTGQIALPEVQLYHYKARVYDPHFGRFLQTDPVLYQDDLNLYAYVGNDPLDKSDPSGTENQRAEYPEAYMNRPPDGPDTPEISNLKLAIGGGLAVLGTGGAACAAGACEALAGVALGKVATAATVGGIVAGTDSALNKNSPAAVAVDTLKGAANSAATSVGGQLSRPAAAGEAAAAFIAGKASGDSDLKAGISAAVSGAVGLVTGNSTTAAEANSVARAVVNQFAKKEISNQLKSGACQAAGSAANKAGC
jgi:RHS repeat-associated protein